MSCNVISQKPINNGTLNNFLLTYYLRTYLLKSNPGNPVTATGYPVPKPVPTSNHYCSAVERLIASSQRNRLSDKYLAETVDAKRKSVRMTLNYKQGTYFVTIMDALCDFDLKNHVIRDFDLKSFGEQ